MAENEGGIRSPRNIYELTAKLAEDPQTETLGQALADHLQKPEQVATLRAFEKKVQRAQSIRGRISAVIAHVQSLMQK